MVLFNYSTKELTAKVVYYGPGLCGKTTNLQWIHEKLPIKNKGKMLSLATETDRTLFFDFLPIELGSIRGMKTRIQLYTVPGQVFYNATRRMVLKGADGVVFVCDSQEAMIEANVESLENLKENLVINEIDPDHIPIVLQYNKRDLPNAAPLEMLNERLNPKGWPTFEAVALKGTGVEETLKGITAVVFRQLSAKYGGGTPAPAPSRPAAPPPAPPPAAPVAAAPPPRPVEPSRPAAPPASAADDDLLDELHADGPEEFPAEVADEFPVDDTTAEPELQLDVSSESDGGIEELTLDEPEPSAPEPTAHATEPPSGNGGAADVSLEPLDEIEEIPAPPPVTARRRPDSPAAPVPATAPAPVHATANVTVRPSDDMAEVDVPIRISLDAGTQRIELHLRLTLDLRRSG